MFGRTSNKEIDEFSRTLAKEVAEQVQAGQKKKAASKNKAERKIGAAMNRIYGKASDFQKQHGLGIYGKARLGNTFKWELREMGYENDFVDEVTKGLLLSLNRK